jgi:eukaryotic-like serine/threonine-protein kinase
MVEANMHQTLKQTPLANYGCDTIEERPTNCMEGVHGQSLAAVHSLCLSSQLRTVPGAVGSAAATARRAFAIFVRALVSAVFSLSSMFAGLSLRRVSRKGRSGVADGQIGPYRLLSPLGAGGMGEVYLAEHRVLNRLCAIKLIRHDRAGDPRIVARFEREMRAMAQLSHCNTVQVFDGGRTADGSLYYVMEYLKGQSFEEIIEQEGPQPAERVLHLLRQACRALHEAHSLGLIHRDIKPGNLFAATQGSLSDVVKVLDFGLVKPVGEPGSTRLTQEGALSGTPLFMSPEQADGSEDVDSRSDIYSLGAVAYMLLTGRPPFEGDNTLQVLMAHLRGEVTPPSQICADVPADLEQVVLRCLAKERDARYSDMQELEQALAQCAAADEFRRLFAPCVI